MRKLFALIPLLFLPLTGCGGGGGTTMTTPPPPPPPPSQVIAPPGPPNVEGLIVDAGPTALTTPSFNTAYISVKLCIPGTTTCQTIDHVEVDTGSSGLRLVAGPSTGPSAGELTLALPALMDSNNHPLAECLQFADGTIWGSINVADISLPTSGETAASVNVHVIGSASVGGPNGAPAGCTGKAENTVPLFGANGILGVGPFVNDCDSTGICKPATPPTAATYYACTTATSCSPTTVTLQQQVQNPGTLFAKDNNGVIVELPAVSASGQAGPAQSVGSLVFGIDTESNNASSGATKLPMCPASGVSGAGACGPGTVSATLNGTTYPNSYLDSGSNANFFPASLTKCAGANFGFYCPSPSPVNESAMLQGTDGTMLAADFSVANADSLFVNQSFTMFSNVAGPNVDNTSLDLGLAYFYGHNVFTGFEDIATSAAPYFAY